MFPGNQTSHGGSARKGRRKIARPLCTDRFLHVVYRAKRAKGERSFLLPENARAVAEILDRTVAETSVTVKRYRNVGNHFHLLVKGTSPEALRRFFRLFPQRVALAVTGAKKGAPRGRFFDEVVFTRVVEWGSDYANVERYLVKNAFEQLGFAAAEVREMMHAVRTLPANRERYRRDLAYRGEDIATRA